MAGDQEEAGGRVMTRRMFRLWLVAAALAAAVAVTQGRATAHGFVKESHPADGERLATPPQEIRVVFTEPIETGVSRVRLLDASGAEVPGTSQSAVGDVELRLQVSEPLAAGEYVIDWQVLAKDGHVTEGTIRFTVEASEPEQTPTPPPPAPISRPSAEPPRVGAPADGTPSGGPTLPAAGILAGAGLAVVGLGVWWWKRWRR